MQIFWALFGNHLIVQIYYFMSVKLTFWNTFGKPCRTSLKCGVEKKEIRGGSWLLHSDRKVWWILMSNPTRLSEQSWTWRVWNHSEASLHSARMFLRYLCSSRGRLLFQRVSSCYALRATVQRFHRLSHVEISSCLEKSTGASLTWNMLLRTRRVNASLSKVKERLK